MFSAEITAPPRTWTLDKWQNMKNVNRGIVLWGQTLLVLTKNHLWKVLLLFCLHLPLLLLLLHHPLFAGCRLDHFSSRRDLWGWGAAFWSAVDLRRVNKGMSQDIGSSDPFVRIDLQHGLEELEALVPLGRLGALFILHVVLHNKKNNNNTN